MHFRFIDEEQVRRSISPQACLEAVEEGFRQYARGEVQDAYGALVSDAPPEGLHLYGASAPGAGLGAKVLGVFPQNPEHGRPYIRAWVLVIDSVTGELEAILDGAYLTALRTGAASALGAQCLARRNRRVLGILGSGLQARTHLLCHLASYPYERVVIWGRNSEKVSAFVEEMTPHSTAKLQVLSSPEAVLEVADVIAGTTSATEPLFPPTAVRPGTHLSSVAPFRLGQSEFPIQLLDRARLYVDSRPKFYKNWGVIPLPLVTAELGEVLEGNAQGRIRDSEITFFKPEGMGFQDLVSARVVLDSLNSQVNGAANQG